MSYNWKKETVAFSDCDCFHSLNSALHFPVLICCILFSIRVFNVFIFMLYKVVLVSVISLHMSPPSNSPPSRLPENNLQQHRLSSMLCRNLPLAILLQFSSVAQLCLTLCNPMDCSTPGFLVHHQIPEHVQIHVHRVGDSIQPFHTLLSPSLPTFNLSQQQGLYQGVSSLHQVAKVLEFQSLSFQ